MIRTSTREEAKREHDRYLRRQAVHIVAQLPEDEQEALRVLGFARELVLQFIGQDQAVREYRALKLVQQADEGDF